MAQAQSPKPGESAPEPASAGDSPVELVQRVASLEQRVRQLERLLGANAGGRQPGRLSEDSAPAFPQDLEARLAGSFLNYVGLLALLVGLALLIGYWMEAHALRALLLALLSAGGLAGLPALLHLRASQMLSFTMEGSAFGLGLVAAYLSFHWLGLPLSLLLAAATALVAMRRALNRNSQLLAAFALLAALMAPLLLRAAQSGAGFLFGYLALLNAGAVWTARQRGWIRLRYLALIGSHVAAWFWYLNHPGAQLMLTAAFPLLTFFLFAWVVPPGSRNASEGVLGSLNSLGLLAASFSIVHQQWPALASWVPLALGVVHAGIAPLFWRSASRRPFAALHGWAGGVLIAVGMLLTLPSAIVAIGWIGEALVLGWLGVRWNRGWLRSIADLLGIGATLALWLFPSSSGGIAPRMDWLAAAVLAAGVYLLHRLRTGTVPGSWEWSSRWLLAILAAGLPMLILSRTLTAAGVSPLGLDPRLLASALWAAYAAALCLIGWVALSPFLRWMGVALLLMTAVKVFLVDPRTLSPASRIGSFLLLAVFLLLFSYLFQVRRR